MELPLTDVLLRRLQARLIEGGHECAHVRQVRGETVALERGGADAQGGADAVLDGDFFTVGLA
ncbi:hypothetical protein D3C84_726910 [compost metagenome]